MKNLWIILPVVSAIMAACHNNDRSDAYGNFEATEILVSAEVSGKIEHLNIEEGNQVKKGQRVGWIDTTQLHLKKQQLKASIEALKSKMEDVGPQIDVLVAQKRNLIRELDRLKRMKEDGAATDKQLDDMQGQIDVVNRQIKATKTKINTQNAGLTSEIAPLEAQINQLNDQLENSYISMPQDGQVLAKYVEAGEFTTVGKPLVKIADLAQMDLKVYVSEPQLSHIALGQQVQVLIDQFKSTDLAMFEGTVSWIASEAEFTPKIVQTREERVNLVYAVKIKVVNEGALKIGMPAEVQFDRQTVEY